MVYFLCTIPTWRPSFGSIRPMVGWRWLMAAAATPWSSVFNTKNTSPIRERLPLFSGRMALHLRFNNDGVASVSDASEGASPFYMEAEINSPMCRLRPGEACQLETDWFPTRADSEFHGVTDAGTRDQAASRSQFGEWQGQAVRFFWSIFPGQACRTLLQRTRLEHWDPAACRSESD